MPIKVKLELVDTDSGKLVEDLKQQVSEKLESLSGQAAARIKEKSNSMMNPDEIKDKDENNVIMISNPNELEYNKTHRVLDTVWDEIPGMIRREFK